MMPSQLHMFWVKFQIKRNWFFADEFEVDFSIATCAVPWNSFFPLGISILKSQLSDLKWIGTLLTILDGMYTLLFSFILSVTELAKQFSVLMILLYYMFKPKSDMSSTKYLLRVELWRWNPVPMVRGVLLVWLYALSLLLCELYCSWRLLYHVQHQFWQNVHRLFNFISLCCCFRIFLGPHKI